MGFHQTTIITGCQRSGTTLLGLILATHPDIHEIDEMQFKLEHVQQYITAPQYGPRVCFKIPNLAHLMNFFEALNTQVPGTKILCSIRDPRDVVSSMLKLKIGGQDFTVHPHGAIGQIDVILEVLTSIPDDLVAPLDAYHKQMKRPAESRSHDDKILVAALLWRLKQELIPVYEAAGLDYQLVKYEALVSNPAEEIHKVIDFVGAPWNDCLLSHHTMHSGVSVGNTDNTRAIDTKSLNRWKTFFNEQELSDIGAIVAPSAHSLGYTL